MTVSVIIPAYQSAQTLPRAIASALAQEQVDLNIVVVDDGSTDNTEEVISDLAANDKRITYLRQHNKGPAAARNAGVQASAGELVAFLDADDEWLPEKLKKQVEILHANAEIDLVFTDSIEKNAVNGTEKKLSELNQSVLSSVGELRICGDGSVVELTSGLQYSIYQKHFIHLSSVLLKRSAIESINGFDDRRVGTEDIDFLVRLAKRGRFAYWKAVKAIHHGTPVGLSWQSERWLRELVNYHESCLKSEHYRHLRALARVNLAKSIRALLVYYGIHWSPLKTIGLLYRSLKHGIDHKILLLSLLAAGGPLAIKLALRTYGKAR
jgi:glycosyltransferase involved in cell wall biosynthesis